MNHKQNVVYTHQTENCSAKRRNWVLNLEYVTPSEESQIHKPPPNKPTKNKVDVGRSRRERAGSYFVISIEFLFRAMRQVWKQRTVTAAQASEGNHHH